MHALNFFHECPNLACRLRFPVTLNDSYSGCCPHCGTPTTVAAQQHPQPVLMTPATPVVQAELHLLLDNWRSLFNVGAAFRTADGAGVAHLYLCGITATPEQRKLAKTSLGAEQVIPWSYATNSVELASQLRASGARLWALEGGRDAISLFDVAPPPGDVPLVLVAGNEVAGVDPGILGLCEQVVALPMQGVKRSLNVAVALSIAVYWLRGLHSRQGLPESERKSIQKVQSQA